MTDLRKAAEMALEAFEDIKKYVTDDGAMPENWDAYHEKPYYALEALRQALAQPEQEPINKMPTKIFGPNLEEILNAAGFYRQPEQKPVAWLYNGHLHECDPSDWAESKVKPLYTAPQSKPWVGLTDETLDDVYFCAEGGTTPLETWREQARAIEAKLKEKNGG